MSEVEVIDVEATEEAPPEESVGGNIVINVAKDTVSYDSNMTIPDMIFWMKVVEDLAIKRALGGAEA